MYFSLPLKLILFMIPKMQKQLHAFQQVKRQIVFHPFAKK